MERKNHFIRKIYLTAFTAIGIAAFTPLTSFASPPTISCDEVEGTTAPGGKTIPPYVYKFTVSDDNGITSIKIDGKELGADGGTDYTGTWTSYTTKDITFLVTDTAGNTVKKKVSKDGVEGETELIKEGAAESQTHPVTVETVYVTVEVPATTTPTTATPTTTVPPTTTAAPQTTTVRETVPETVPIKTPSTKETVEETLPAAVETTTTETLPEESELEESTETKYSIPETTRQIYVETETSQAKKISIITEPLVIEMPEIPKLTGLISQEEVFLEKYRDASNAVLKAEDETNTEEAIETSKKAETDSTDSEKEDASIASASNAEKVGNEGISRKAEGELKSVMVIAMGALLLSVLALYNIFVVRLNRKRLRLYKAFLLTVSKKDKRDMEELVSQ